MWDNCMECIFPLKEYKNYMYVTNYVLCLWHKPRLVLKRRPFICMMSHAMQGAERGRWQALNWKRRSGPDGKDKKMATEIFVIPPQQVKVLCIRLDHITHEVVLSWSCCT